MSDAFQSGYAAALACIPARCNPYRGGSFAYAQWTYGYDAGKRSLTIRRAGD